MSSSSSSSSSSQQPSYEMFIDRFKDHLKEYKRLCVASSRDASLKESLSALEVNMKNMVTQMRESDQEAHQFWKERIIAQINSPLVDENKNEADDGGPEEVAVNPLSASPSESEGEDVPPPPSLELHLLTLLYTIAEITGESEEEADKKFEPLFEQILEIQKEPGNSDADKKAYIVVALIPLFQELSIDQMSELHAGLTRYMDSSLFLLKEYIESAWDIALNKKCDCSSIEREGYTTDKMAALVLWVALFLDSTTRSSQSAQLINQVIDSFTLAPPPLFTIADADLFISLGWHLLVRDNNLARLGLLTKIYLTFFNYGAIDAVVQFIYAIMPYPKQVLFDLNGVLMAYYQNREFNPNYFSQVIVQMTQEEKVDLIIRFVDVVEASISVYMIGCLFREHLESAESNPEHSSFLLKRLEERRAFRERSEGIKALLKEAAGEPESPLPLPVDAFLHSHSFLDLRTMARIGRVSKKYLAQQRALFTQYRKELSTVVGAVEKAYEGTLVGAASRGSRVSLMRPLTHLLLREEPVEPFVNTEEIAIGIEQVQQCIVKFIENKLLFKARPFDAVKEGLSKVKTLGRFSFFNNQMTQLIREFELLTQEEFDELLTWEAELESIYAVHNPEQQVLQLRDYFRRSKQRIHELTELGEDRVLTEKSIDQAERIMEQSMRTAALSESPEAASTFRNMLFGRILKARQIMASLTVEHYSGFIYFRQNYARILSLPPDEQRSELLLYLGEMQRSIEALVGDALENGESILQAERIVQIIAQDPSLKPYIDLFEQMIEASDQKEKKELVAWRKEYLSICTLESDSELQVEALRNYGARLKERVSEVSVLDVRDVAQKEESLVQLESILNIFSHDPAFKTIVEVYKQKIQNVRRINDLYNRGFISLEFYKELADWQKEYLELISLDVALQSETLGRYAKRLGERVSELSLLDVRDVEESLVQAKLILNIVSHDPAFKVVIEILRQRIHNVRRINDLYNSGSISLELYKELADWQKEYGELIGLDVALQPEAAAVYVSKMSARVKELITMMGGPDALPQMKAALEQAKLILSIVAHDPGFAQFVANGMESIHGEEMGIDALLTPQDA